jgi:hypothetical protein
VFLLIGCFSSWACNLYRPVGVIAYLDVLKAEALPIFAAVIGGTAITLFVTMVVVNWLGITIARGREQKPGRLEGAVRDARVRAFRVRVSQSSEAHPLRAGCKRR